MHTAAVVVTTPVLAAALATVEAPMVAAGESMAVLAALKMNIRSRGCRLPRMASVGLGC